MKINKLGEGGKFLCGASQAGFWVGYQYEQAPRAPPPPSFS